MFNIFNIVSCFRVFWLSDCCWSTYHPVKPHTFPPSERISSEKAFWPLPHMNLFVMCDGMRVGRGGDRQRKKACLSDGTHQGRQMLSNLHPFGKYAWIVAPLNLQQQDKIHNMYKVLYCICVGPASLGAISFSLAIIETAPLHLLHAVIKLTIGGTFPPVTTSFRDRSHFQVIYSQAEIIYTKHTSS